MHLMRSFVIAFSTYSRIPMPNVKWDDSGRRYAMCFFPLIGVVIGISTWAWLVISDKYGFGPFLRGVVAALIPILVSGGIHMDGFMDTLDAMASWQPAERRLAILKDCHTGAFSVIGCISYLLLSAALFSEFPTSSGFALIFCFVFSRAMSAVTLVLFKSARPDGMLDSFAKASQQRAVLICSTLYILFFITLSFLLMSNSILWCLPITAAITVYYKYRSYRYFGGITGDLAGWYLQVTELLCIVSIIIGGNIA